MGMRINTNMLSVNAQRNLKSVQGTLASSNEKLASGSRINKSSDDAAGLAISENLNANIRSFRQAGRNAQDGISFIQVAEGGMNEVGNMVIRLRELSVQAASDTIGAKERGYLDREAQQLKLEIERIAQSTEYNGQWLRRKTRLPNRREKQRVPRSHQLQPRRNQRHVGIFGIVRDRYLEERIRSSWPR